MSTKPRAPTEHVPTSVFCRWFAINRDEAGVMTLLRIGVKGEPRWVPMGPITREELIHGFLRLTPFQKDKVFKTIAQSCLEHVFDGRHP